ncbi:MAG: PilZ domain-containing protein [Nitrospirae bacterium]|nr:PilZ domain-containing protein [Nitrospirota bacterium]
MIEKRGPQRAHIVLQADIVSGSNTYGAVIKNFSETGLYVETIPTREITDFLPETIIELKFKSSQGETIDLKCEVVWIYSKKLHHGLKQNNLGMEITVPSMKYKRFLEKS